MRKKHLEEANRKLIQSLLEVAMGYREIYDALGRIERVTGNDSVIAIVHETKKLIDASDLFR